VPAQTTFDLLLLGFRNDLARERTLTLLGRMAGRHRIAIVDRETPLPHRLLVGIDHELGLDLCAQLRRSGAQVRLVATQGAQPPLLTPLAAPRRLPVRMLPLLLLLAGLGAFHASFTRGGASQRLGARDEPGAAGRAAEPRSLELNSEAITLSEGGDFAGAADRLRDAIRGEPHHPTLQQNLKVVLHNWAVAELNEGRPENAVEFVRQGLQLDEDRHLLLVLGVALTRTGDLGGARAALERALALGGEDPQTLLALGRVYQQDGNREGAVEMFQHARDLGVTDPEFTIALQRLERELDAEWDYSELSSPHFTVSFAEGKNYAAARRVLESLEQAYFSVGRRLDFYSPERIPVVLHDSEEFHDITQAPSWMGALYDGRIKLPVHGLDRGSPILDRTVRHEYAHAIVSQLTRGRCPVWLNEGVAIWAEESVDGERRAWAEAAVAGRELFFLADLQGPFSELPKDRISVAYAQSYLTVRRLLDDFGAGDVRALLTAIGSGTPLQEAFVNVFSRTLGDFENDVVRHLTG
jgi:tetratricopeptide (TPR) repeat protein